MSETSTNKAETGVEKLGYVDAMRGLAFLAVLVAHAGVRFPDAPWKRFTDLGNYGVQLFFVVSAFTLFLSCESRFPKDRRPLLAFLTRRFFRLAPMFWLGVLIYTFLPGRDTLIPPERVGFVHYLTAITFTHAWHPQTIDAVVPGGWSIGVECSFYLILPVLWKYLRSAERAGWFILISIVFSPLISRLAGVVYHLDTERAEDNIFLNWWLPNQLGVFGCGILLFHWGRKLDAHSVSRSASLLLLVTSALLIHSLKDLHTARLLPGGLIFGFSFLLLGLGLRLWSFPVLVNRATRWTGRLSYSCYLTHFLVLEMVVASWHLGPLQHLWPMEDLPRFVLLVVVVWAATVLISEATYRALEAPGIALGRNLIEKWGLASPKRLPPNLPPNDLRRHLHA